MRVVFLTNFIPPYRLPVLKILQARIKDFSILISTPMEPDRDWPVDWGGLQVELQKTIIFKQRHRHTYGFTDYSFVHIPYDTISRLRKIKPDIIITAELGFRSLLAAIYSWLNRKVRLILYADLSEHTEKSRGILRKLLRLFLISQADVILVNGESGKRYIDKMSGAHVRTVIVPYATDLSNLERCKNDRNHDPKEYRLLYVGSLIEKKGLLPFLETLSTWGIENKERRVVFTIVGNGPLLNEVELFKTPDNIVVNLVKHMPYRDLLQVYCNNDIFVLPTLSDTWALVVNEAMVSGRPVLGSVYSQAVEELVSDGKTGWIYSIEHNGESYEKLDLALNTPREELRKMGALAKKRAKQLSPEYVSQLMVDVIQEVHRGKNNYRT